MTAHRRPTPRRSPRPVVHLDVRRRAGAQPAARARPAAAHRDLRAGLLLAAAARAADAEGRLAGAGRDPRTRGSPARRGRQRRRHPHPGQGRQPRSLRARLPLDRRRPDRVRDAAAPTPCCSSASSGATSTAHMRELRRGDEVLASGPEAVWAAFAPLHAEKMRQRAAIVGAGEGADRRRQLPDRALRRLAERRLALEHPPAAERAARQAGDRARPRRAAGRVRAARRAAVARARAARRRDAGDGVGRRPARSASRSATSSRPCVRTR